MSPRAAPTSVHREVRAAGLDELVLALHFVHEIRQLERIETEIVARACATLTGQELFSAPSRMRASADEVAATEASHAVECRAVLERATARAPRRVAVALNQPPMPSFTDAVHVVANRAARPSLVYLFAAVISETLGAGRMLVAGRDPTVESFYADFFERHARAEREHARLFADVCRVAWLSLGGDDQRAVLGFLPPLLDCYVFPSRATCVAILEDADLDAERAERIFSETYRDQLVAKIIRPQVQVATRVFARAGMLDSPAARQAFGGYVRTSLP